MQKQIFDRHSAPCTPGSISDGIMALIDAIKEDEAKVDEVGSGETATCDCPPGLCLGEVVQDLGLDADMLPPGVIAPGRDASPEAHAAFGERLAEHFAAILPRGPDGEKPKVVFGGAYHGDRRLDAVDAEPAKAEIKQHVFGGERVFEPFPGCFGDNPDTPAFEKRIVVAQLVRSIENIGAAAATAARLVEETFED